MNKFTVRTSPNIGKEIRVKYEDYRKHFLFSEEETTFKSKRKIPSINDYLCQVIEHGLRSMEDVP